MPQRPVIYLDVDGVLNAFSMWRFTQPKDCYTDFEEYHNIYEESVMLSKHMARDLHNLSIYADVMWLTYWLEAAPQRLAPALGLPDWDWIDWEPTKHEALIEDQLLNPRPFVWIDDDEITDKTSWLLKERLDTLSKPPAHLLIRPSARTGIKPSEMQTVEEFVRRHNQ